LFSWFANYAVVLADGAGHYVHGNSFGVDTAGTGSVFGNVANVILSGNAGAATIGGIAPAQRNLFGSAQNAIGTGVSLASKNSHVVVRNNYIGTSASGTQARANANAGIFVSASQYNLIANNVIAANDGAGIKFIGSATTDVAYNVLQNNRIGVGVDGSALGNGAAGVWVAAHAQNNAIGGAVYSDLLGGNQIQSNVGPGVQIDGGGFYNGVFANSIQLNGGLPIDLDVAGPLVNDPLDADGGSNEGQNKPVITRAIRIDSYTMHIEGTLASKPTKPFYLNFYASSACDASGFGPAVVPLGALLTGNSAGVVTATASSAGTSIGSTSELSACQTYLPDRIFTDGFESPPPPSK
jgi:parallel beta-helix repeat protein